MVLLGQAVWALDHVQHLLRDDEPAYEYTVFHVAGRSKNGDGQGM